MINPEIIKRQLVPIIILLYSIVVIITSWHHEISRDEMRALSQAIESQSALSLLSNKQGEGNPVLWQMLLYYGYQVFNTPRILKVLSVTFGILAIYIFISRSPFTLPIKILFAFGYYPLYEYSVISRNYGISMSILFGICYLYPKRFEKIVSIGIMLLLLAHTNTYGTVIATSIGISLIIETVIRNKELVNNEVKQIRLGVAFTIVTVGLALFIVYMYPLASNIWQNLNDANIAYFKDLVKAMVLPGKSVNKALGFENYLFTSMIIGTMSIYLLGKPYIFIIYIFSYTVIGLLNKWHLMPLATRHQGMLVILMIAVFWLDQVETRTQEFPGMAGRILSKLSNVMPLLLIFLLVMQLANGILAVRNDIRHEYSSSRRFGNFIRETPEIRNAIIIGEPDYRMESLPYYVDNPIYLPRENRFGTYVTFTAEIDKYSLSLKELMTVAVQLKKERNRPVLIVIGHQLTDHGPYKIEYSYDKTFTYKPQSLRELRNLTDVIASFRNAKYENYDVYLLK